MTRRWGSVKEAAAAYSCSEKIILDIIEDENVYAYYMGYADKPSEWWLELNNPAIQKFTKERQKMAKKVQINRRLEVVSTNIKALGYDLATQVLELVFVNDGSVYRYLNVPPEQFCSLANAESVGKYFQEHIREEYNYDKVAG
jgi:hypothetical protein